MPENKPSIASPPVKEPPVITTTNSAPDAPADAQKVPPIDPAVIVPPPPTVPQV